MKKSGISHQITFFNVQDLEITKQFYEDLLGFDLILDQGSCRIIRTVGNGLLGYCSGSNRIIGGDGVLITLVTPRVDEWYEYLVSRGVTITNPPQYNPDYKIYHFFFRDPDGYQLEIQEFRDPSWRD